MMISPFSSILDSQLRFEKIQFTFCKNNRIWQIILRLAVILCVLSALPAESAAQLNYDHTTFLHGFASDSTIWNASYVGLGTSPPTYLGRSIVLNQIGYPNLDLSQRYSGQVAKLAAYLTQGGHHAIVAHSMGSLVARGTYIDNPARRPSVAAMITVTAPHQGAPLADNFVELRNFLRDMQRRIQDGIAAASVEAIVYDMVFVALVPKQITGLGPALFGFILYKVNSSSIDLTNLDQYGAAPAFVDLSPNSTAIAHLNNSFDDGSVARANIYATIPFRNAALRLLQSSTDDDAHFPNLVRTRDKAQELFSTCKWAGYVSIVMWTAGRRCAYARKTLGRLDDRWAKYVNGWDAYGNPRFVPFDGVVPNERSHYPSTNGVAYEANVNLINHLNVYKTQAGLNQVANAMRAVRMLVVGGPPPSVSPVTITGPSTVNLCGGAWFAAAAGGVAPFTYSWTANGHYYTTGSSNEFDYSPTAYGSLSIVATVTDANGTTGTGSKTVTVSTRGLC